MMLSIDMIKLELITNEIELRNAIEDGNYLRAFELKLQKDHLMLELNALLESELNKNKKTG